VRARAALLGLLLLAPLPAWASNYFLEQITALASRGEIRKLRRAGLRTTDDLARRGATAPGRQDLQRRTGIPLTRIVQLSSLADLMRLKGVGPDAARVMAAAGCRSIAELQQADPAALADAIKRVNDRAHLSTNPPRAENLVVWIAQAREIAPLFHPGS